MGYYINPRNESKEEFLAREGKPISLGAFSAFTNFSGDHLPVCLVNNGMFTAAGVGVDRREVEAFSYSDGRPKKFYLVPRAKLIEVGALQADEDYTATM